MRNLIFLFCPKESRVSKLWRKKDAKNKIENVYITSLKKYSNKFNAKVQDPYIVQLRDYFIIIQLYFCSREDFINST